MSHEIKKSRTSGKKPTIKIIAFCAFLVLFAISSYKFLGDKLENRRAEKSYAEIQMSVRQTEYQKAADNLVEEEAPEEVSEKPKEHVISMDFTPLKEVNQDIIAWIRAEGTNIDYPVTLTDNNDFYLTHLYNREENVFGSIFMDCRCKGDFSDRNSVIYGHHMQNGTMFATLAEYKSQDFYDANPTMTICTPDGDYTLELICGTIEDGNNEFVRFYFDNDEDFLDYINGFRERSSFVSDVELNPDDRVVSLCTCTYEQMNARYMVIGRLVPVLA